MSDQDTFRQIGDCVPSLEELKRRRALNDQVISEFTEVLDRLMSNANARQQDAAE